LDFANDTVTLEKLSGKFKVSYEKLMDNGLEGVSFADLVVSNAKLAPNSVGGASWGPQSVTSSKLAPDLKSEPKLANNSTTEEKFASDSVTEKIIAGEAVGNSNIIDKGITANEIESGFMVTGEKLAEETLTNDSFKDQAFTADKINWIDENALKIALKLIGAVKFVNTEALLSNAVTTAKIADGAVTTNAIADDAVSSDKIAPGTVSGTFFNVNSDDLATASIGTKSLAPKSVDSVSGDFGTQLIQSGAVGGENIVEDAVTSSVIAEASVGSSAIQNNAVTTAKLSDESITEKNIAVASVKNEDINDSAIETADIRFESLAARPIADGSVSWKKIQNRLFEQVQSAINQIGYMEVFIQGIDDRCLVTPSASPDAKAHHKHQKTLARHNTKAGAFVDDMHHKLAEKFETLAEHDSYCQRRNLGRAVKVQRGGNPRHNYKFKTLSYTQEASQLNAAGRMSPSYLPVTISLITLLLALFGVFM